MRDKNYYIGKCEHEECDEQAERWLAVELILKAPISREQRLFEDYGYLCTKHAEKARNSNWDIVEDFDIKGGVAIDKVKNDQR